MNNTGIVRRRILLRDFLIANIAGGFGVLLMFFGILLQMEGMLPKTNCVFLNVTHVNCPGCGGSRALMAFIKGRFLTSLLYNPAVLSGALLLIYYELGVVITIVKNDGRYHFSTKLWPVYAYLIAVMLFAVIRDVLLAGFGIDLIGIAGGL